MQSLLLDSNRLSFWLVVIWCLVAGLRAIRSARSSGGRGAAIDAAITVAFVGAAAGIARVLAPAVAGGVAVAAWGGAVLAPLALSALAADRALRRDFRAAAAIHAGLGLLRPFSRSRAVRDYYRALAWVAAGQHRAGSGLLARLESDPDLGVLAVLERLTLARDWSSVCGLAERLAGEDGAMGAQVLPRYLRALGELGELDALLAALARYRGGMGRRPTLLLQALLFAFAFGGRRGAVEELLRGPLSVLDPASRAIWTATAELAQGEVEAGMARLAAARSTADAQQRDLIEARVARPPVLAPATIAPLLDGFEGTARALARSVPGFGPRRLPVATLLLTALVLAGFFLELRLGGAFRSDTLERLGALDPPRVAAGEWWRVVTALFLHMGPVHLLMNLTALVPIGTFLERRLGSWRVGLLLVVSGAVPMAAHVGLWALGAEPTTTVGASGAVMGGLGAVAAVLLRGVWEDRLPEAQRFLRSVATLVAVQVVVDLAVPIIDFLGHSLGLTVGFLLGAAFVRLGRVRTLVVAAPALAFVVLGYRAAEWMPWRHAPCGPGEVTLCDALCDLGVPEACAAMGYKLSVGKDIPADPERARERLRRACDGGVAESCRALRRSSRRTVSGRPSEQQLLTGLERACARAEPGSCRFFGAILAHREGIDESDRERGRRVLVRACQRDDGEACDALAELCDRGDVSACLIAEPEASP